MDLIERWMGFSLNGGDGSLELLILATVAAAAAVAFAWWCARRRV